ncbi:hypothetical protein TVAG_104000 [Trichomonas vaginalis G3]|uniref:Cullin neddylation domain-containing protein n=1 Tax=Trichomonas vaginalis (strain ATCC PRA-98 / G3) TaxID=412133 RepID=A2FN39_TRIV3|nr:Cullin family [Trichomonas vaginalis G3]EAX93681.1 hypothetical protein TVAG_104000 [Trichomonas vaginalis G3]KAI5540898.1 Cullin family [Trichomonas vaginalis G3]|eukprot:XP_001306611.1 hypothetical protein [Trichomonas vaginalis G3]
MTQKQRYKLSSQLKFNYDDISECTKNVSEALNMIIKHRTKEINFMILAKSFYSILSCGDVIDYMNKVNDMIRETVTNIYLEAKKPESETVVSYLEFLSSIYDSYSYFMRHTTAIFSPFETQLNQYNCKIQFFQDNLGTLIDTLKKEKIMNNFAKCYVDHIFNIVKTTTVNDIENDERLNIIYKLKSMLKLIASSQIEIIKFEIRENLPKFLLEWIETQGLPTNLDENTESLDEELAENQDDLDDQLMATVKAYPDACYNILKILDIAISRSIDPETGNETINFATEFFLDLGRMYTHEILRSVSMFCLARDKDTIEELCGIFNKKCQLKPKIAEIVGKMIVNEPQEFSNMCEVVNFYDLLLNTIFVGDNSLIEAISMYVNVDTKELINKLNMEFHQILFQGGSIADYSGILKYMYSKDDFVFDYAGLCVQRFLINGTKQLPAEMAAKSVIANSSLVFSQTISLITQIIDGKMKSDEMGFPNVLILSTTHWPFKSAYSKPKFLRAITDPIEIRYKQMFPQNTITFPTNYWYITVRYEGKKCLLSGTGPQIEILLAFNSNQFITSSMFNPEIPAALSFTAIDSLTDQSCELLRKAGEMYFLKTDFTPASNIIHLPIPKEYEDEESKKLFVDRDRIINAAICRIMKHEKTMFEKDLWNRVYIELSQKFPLTRSDFSKNLALAISQGYVERKTEVTLVYIE